MLAHLVASFTSQLVITSHHTKLHILLPVGHQSQLDQDEALARQLQQQLDVEEAYPHYSQEATQASSQPSAPNRTPATAVAHDLAQSLFAFDRPQEEERGNGRGRGRGGRRGSRGRGTR